MPIWLYVLLAALALATWAHFAYWGKRLRLRPEVDQLLFARTDDGWRLALGRRRPRGPARPLPVILCHGIATNHHVMDFAAPGLSLALTLAGRGFDCFSLDVRGHGDSVPEPGARKVWTLDDYLWHDIPAALDAVKEETGSEQVLWVGHSQGALLGLAACALHPTRIAGVVAIAPPGQWGPLRPCGGWRASARWVWAACSGASPGCGHRSAPSGTLTSPTWPSARRTSTPSPTGSSSPTRPSR